MIGDDRRITWYCTFFISFVFSCFGSTYVSFPSSHWDTGERHTWCTGSGQRGEGCVPNWGMTCQYRWSVAQTLYLCVKVMGNAEDLCLNAWIIYSDVTLNNSADAWNYFCDTCIKSVDKLDRLVGSDLCGWNQTFPANTRPVQWENKRRGRAVGKRRRQHGRVSACLSVLLCFFLLAFFCGALQWGVGALMVGGWDRRNSIKLPGHSNVWPTGLHKRGRKGRRGLRSFSLRACEWCVDARSDWVGNVQFDAFWASDLSSRLSSWAGKASSIHSFVFKESVLVEQRSFLWVIGSCSEAVNQTRDWSSWLMDCTLWSKD